MLPLPSTHWTSQPPPAFTRLNRSHPISRGLVDMWVCNELNAPNQVRPQYRLIQTENGQGECYQTAGIGGRVQRCHFNSGDAHAGYLTATGATSNYCAGDISIRIVFVPQDWRGATFTTLMMKNNTIAVAREIGIFVNSSGNISYLEIGSSGGAQSGAEGMVTGGLWDFVLTRSGSTANTYVNGVAKSTYGSYGATAGGGTASPRWNSDETGGGSAASIDYYLIQIWNRAVSAQEIAAMYFEPYNTLMPPNTWWARGTVTAVVDNQDWFGSVAVPRQRTNISVMY